MTRPVKGGQVGRAGQNKKRYHPAPEVWRQRGPSPFLMAMSQGPACETLCSCINVLPRRLGSETNSSLLPTPRPPTSTWPENSPAHGTAQAQGRGPVQPLPCPPGSHKDPGANQAPLSHECQSSPPLTSLTTPVRRRPSPSI